MENKILEIESQIVDSDSAADYLRLSLRLAKEAGYTQVRDNWGIRAWDDMTIDEAIEKFKRPNDI